MFRQKPSFWNFLVTRNSYAQIIPFGLGIAFVLLAFQQLVLDGSPATGIERAEFVFFLVGGILLTGSVIIVQWRKFSVLASIFETGPEIGGVILDVYFFRGSGYVTYEYLYQGLKHRYTDSINRNRKTKEMRSGQKVMLFVNHASPAQAFIRDLYLG